jgi:hypothetical protein
VLEQFGEELPGTTVRRSWRPARSGQTRLWPCEPSLELAAVAGSTAQVAIGEDVGAVHAPVCAAPARFEPADNRRARHAEQYGSLAGRQHLVWFEYSFCGFVPTSARISSISCAAAADEAGTSQALVPVASQEERRDESASGPPE